MVSVQMFFSMLGILWLAGRRFDLPWLVGWNWLWLLVAVSGFVAAQLGTFVALRFIPGSRIAPLLGLKVGLLAVVSWLLGMEVMSAWRWVAVCCICVAFVLVMRSGALPWRGLLAVLWTIASFALADICSKQLIDAMPSQDILAVGDLLAAQYVAGGALVSPLLVQAANRPRWSERGVVIPYATCWLLAVWCLMYAFAHAGLLLTVFCQALRGPMAVALGWALATRGFSAYEENHGRSMWIRQFIAACLMVIAIVVDLLVR
jgi:drug/metabolite transporter (DMT)-like permease